MPRLVPDVLAAGTLAAIEQPTLIVDDELLLRPWGSGDTAAVRAAFADAGIQRWHMRRVDTEEEAAEWIESWQGRWMAETDAAWAVAERSTGEAIGYVALRSVMLAAAQAQLSYWVLPPARGQGIATRAAGAVAHWGFDLGLHRIFLVHSLENKPSCGVAETIGFPVEGTMRDYMRHADGWHDMHLHARVAAGHERVATRGTSGIA